MEKEKLERTMLSPAEVAEITGIHEDTIRRQCRDGIIPDGAKRKFGRRWRISRAWAEGRAF